MRLLPFLIVGFLIITSPASAQSTCDFYVATTGSNGNAGSSSSPWASVAFAASGGGGAVGPGRTVCVRPGVYRERVEFAVSGSPGQPITFRGEGGRPVLDGTGLTVSDNGMVFFNDRQHLVFEGFEIRNYVSTTDHLDADGIRILGQSNDITIRGNVIHNIGADTPSSGGANAHGILVWGTASSPIYNLVIENNELYNLTLGNSEALTVKCNVRDFRVEGNHVHDVNNIGIDIVGTDSARSICLDVARDGVVVGNRVERASSCSNPSAGGCSAGGIYVDGGRDVIVERNYVEGADIGIEIAAENREAKPTLRVTVRSNVVANNRIAGIALGGYEAGRAGTEACSVVGNTLYHNDTRRDGNGEVWIQHRSEGNEVANNLLFAGAQGLFIGSYNTQSSTTLDHNLYYTEASSPRWVWNAASYGSLSTYRSGSNQDSGGLFGDPRLSNDGAGDYTLGARSPAVDAGDASLCAVGSSCVGDLDFSGGTRMVGGQVDIGAFEKPEGVSVIEGPEHGFTLELSSSSPDSERFAFRLQTHSTQHVTVSVHDALGRTVATLLDASVGPETELFLNWSAQAVSPGLYFVRARGNGAAVIRSVVVAR